MNDNTILRIKVPAHLYESVKEQLTLKEAKSGKAHYGAGMEVVKEKKAKPVKDGMHKVEEEKDMKDNKKPKSLEELKAIKEKLDKKIHEMENASKKEKVEENINEAAGPLELVQQIIADPKNTYDLLKTAAGMAPHEFDVLLAGLGTIGTFLGGGVGLAIKNAVKKAEAEKAEKPEKAEVAELFGFGSKDKFKKGDIVLYKDETTPRKVLNVVKGSDKKTIYVISSPEQNGQFFTSGTTNASEDNLKPANK